jgi:hypothetical protein
MSSPNLIRWSGLAVILVGLLMPATWIIDLVTGSTTDLTRAVGFAASILLVFGLMGIYGIQIRESGVSGFLGFLLTEVSNCFAMGQTWLPESGQLVGIAGILGPLIGIMALPGYILLGIGSWKAGKLPRWSILLWIIGYSLSFVSMLISITGFEIAEYFVVLGIVIWGIGLIGAGIKLMAIAAEPAREPVTAT